MLVHDTEQLDCRRIRWEIVNFKDKCHKIRAQKGGGNTHSLSRSSIFVVVVPLSFSQRFEFSRLNLSAFSLSRQRRKSSILPFMLLVAELSQPRHQRGRPLRAQGLLVPRSVSQKSWENWNYGKLEKKSKLDPRTVAFLDSKIWSQGIGIRRL